MAEFEDDDEYDDLEDAEELELEDPEPEEDEEDEPPPRQASRYASVDELPDDPQLLKNLLVRAHNNDQGRARRLERELQTMRRLIEERTAGPAAAEEEEDPLPDPEADLSGFIVKSFDRLERKLAGVEEKADGQAKQSREDREALALYDRTTAEIEEFRTEKADYNEVVGGVANALFETLVRDHGLTEDEARENLSREIFRIRIDAAKAGKNAGAMIYAEAISAAKKLGLPVPGMGAMPRRKEPPPADPGRRKVREERDRQRGSRSLASLAPGRSPGAGKDLGKMDLRRASQEEYDALAESVGGGRRGESNAMRQILASRAVRRGGRGRQTVRE
jgi:hypothetical protein